MLDNVVRMMKSVRVPCFGSVQNGVNRLIWMLAVLMNFKLFCKSEKVLVVIVKRFFQIHNFADTCNASPSLMLKFDNGVLRVDSLQGLNDFASNPARGDHANVLSSTVLASSLMGQDVSLRVLFDTGRFGSVSVYLDGQRVVNNASMETPDCATPHIKLGIYRPHDPAGGTSRMWFRDTVVFPTSPPS